MISEKRKEVRKKLKKLEGLPTLPPIVQKLSHMIEDEKVSLNQIAEVIEKDQVITSKLLRIANSAFYGFPKRISTVQSAIFLLGINVIRILIMTSSIFEIIHREDVGLWEHSIGVAACSKILAERISLKEPQEIATAGLLHDLGRVIQKVSFKEEYEEIRNLVKRGVDPLKAEEEILGLNHSDLGAFLLRQWNLPERLIETVLAHHELEKAKEFKREATVVHLADVLIHARGYGETLYQKVPSLNSKSLSILKISPEEFKDIFLALEPKLYELKFFTQELQKEL
ncbi:MAG: HDOD domain-containing protein [Thermodesulfobacteriaceae bacterium]|nr:HDOD domain-containing protein [Thermodesulfobacteriaceae bacterium]MCX8041527.1 HDOD domain-containing protein [Thermodesulfobacteriaceae bacterium]MDW8135976.1 HDOD domain-containing protein [Thermodesulfobacterium sp.]